MSSDSVGTLWEHCHNARNAVYTASWLAFSGGTRGPFPILTEDKSSYNRSFMLCLLVTFTHPTSTRAVQKDLELTTVRDFSLFCSRKKTHSKTQE